MRQSHGPLKTRTENWHTRHIWFRPTWPSKIRGPYATDRRKTDRQETDRRARPV